MAFKKWEGSANLFHAKRGIINTKEDAFNAIGYKGRKNVSTKIALLIISLIIIPKNAKKMLHF